VQPESIVQIISAVIGSTLIVTALTSLSSVINNPDIYLNIQQELSKPESVEESDASDKGVPVSAYQIIARNDGRAPATNVTLSMFFRANISNWEPILHSEEINDYSRINYSDWSLLYVEIPRFTSGAVMIVKVDVIDATVVTPYYVSAAYDQSSNQFPNYLPADIQSGRFPDILAGRSDPIQLVIIVSLILSALAFAVALLGIGSLRRFAGRSFPINKNDLIWFAPAIVLSSVFLLYVFEELPRNLLISSLILNRPADVTTGLDVRTIPEGAPYNQGILILGAFVFCGLSWIARGFVGYVISKKIIHRLFRSVSMSELDKFIESKRFKWICYVLVGTPFYSFVLLFLPRSTEEFYSASLFMLFLVIDICRMLVLVLVVPKVFLGHRTRTEFLYYPLIAVSMLIAILHLLFVTLILKAIATNNIEVMDRELLWPIGLILVFSVIIGVIQGFIGAFTAHYYVSKKPSKKLVPRSSTIWTIGISSIGILWTGWLCLLVYVTSFKPIMLVFAPPIIGIGIICILSGVPFVLIVHEIKRNPRFSDKKSNDIKIHASLSHEQIHRRIIIYSFDTWMKGS
jgi:hypothetical protein